MNVRSIKEKVEMLPGLALILGAAAVQVIGVGAIIWLAWRWWQSS